MKRQRISTEQRWRQTVTAQQVSGIPPAKYCQEENICRTSFYAWRKRLGMIPQAVVPAVGTSTDERIALNGFMQLQQPMTTFKGILIETPNGYYVQTPYAGESGVKSVLELLRCL